MVDGVWTIVIQFYWSLVRTNKILWSTESRIKLVTVRVAPSLNGLVLLFGLIWFSVKWAEVSIGLVRFGFSFTMGWFDTV